MADGHRALLLPLYYEALSIEDIDTVKTRASALEEPSESRESYAETLERILRVIVALDGVDSAKSVTPGAVFPGAVLWPRIIAWVDFLDEFHEQLQPILKNSVALGLLPYEIYLNALVAALIDNRDPSLSKPYPDDVADRLLYLVGRSWPHILQGAHVEHSNSLHTHVARPTSRTRQALRAITFIMEEVARHRPEAFMAPLLAGVGGLWDRLARVIVQQFQYCLKGHNPEKPFDTWQLMSIAGLHPPLDRAASESGAPALRHALARAGVIPCLVTINRILARQTLPDSLKTIPRDFLRLSAQMLRVQNAQKYMVQALKAGYLSLLFSYSHGPNVGAFTRENQTQTHARVIANIMPLTYYPSVLRQLQVSLGEVKNLDSRVYLQPFAAVEQWEELLEKTHRHSLALHDLDEGVFPWITTGACDNFKCAAIVNRKLLKRCSECIATFYCSTECQRADWVEGHRHECPTFAEFRPTSVCPPINAGSLARHGFDIIRRRPFTAQDSRFQRAMLSAQYEGLESQALMWITMLEGYDAATGDFPIAIWDYSSGKPEIHTISQQVLAEEWSVYLARVKRSAGRVQLHLVRRDEGGIYLSRAVFVHFATTELFDGMKTLAEGKASAWTEAEKARLQPRVKELLLKKHNWTF
ncbi:hypothetical protein MIND_01405100 [Mycena indigotica]|uniref:MYND-type domain-containing protein n=1 Tax=Mycena indigotica TaxID=2126181 RepID=A0A8H6RXT1_9AGAR|nr:uncharacterized protein MIND_01405100 [Mycena indigotica]KAF7288891.1 hypothetical protein MIND_01405100 [Mycena indigotica]